MTAPDEYTADWAEFQAVTARSQAELDDALDDLAVPVRNDAPLVWCFICGVLLLVGFIAGVVLK